MPHAPTGGTYRVVLTPVQELALAYYAERYAEDLGGLPVTRNGCGAGASPAAALQVLVDEMLETMLSDMDRLARALLQVLASLPPGLARAKMLQALDSEALRVYLTWVTDDPQAS
jgi:hypothetical protein